LGFGTVEIEGGGDGILGECGIGGPFRWYAGRWEVCIDRYPERYGMECTLGSRNSLFFVGIGIVLFQRWDERNVWFSLGRPQSNNK